jgi:uncharacterized protein
LNKEQIVATLKNHQANFKQLGVVRLALFGSVVRNEATENSDIDLLVTFSRSQVPLGNAVLTALRSVPKEEKQQWDALVTKSTKTKLHIF